MRFPHATARFFLLFTMVPSCAEPSDLVEALQRNQAAIERITSYHLTIRSWEEFELNGKMLWDHGLDNITEIYQDDHRRKVIRRIFRAVGPDGVMKESESEHGKVNQTSYDAKEYRVLNGWDPEHPFPLPLEFGRNAKEFGLVGAQIIPRDPTQAIRQFEMGILLWQIIPHHDLTSLSEKFDLVLKPAPDADTVRIELASTRDPNLKDDVGTLVDLSKSHDWLVKRIERPAPHSYDAHHVMEVQLFKKFGDQYWYPAKIHDTGTYQNERASGVSKGDTEIEFHSINTPIPEELLKLEFPEGARVNEVHLGRIHIWGKGAPAKTFNSFEDYESYLFARAKEYQASRQARQGPAEIEDESSHIYLFLVINAVLVGLLILLTVLRRKLARRGSSNQQENAA